MTLANMQFRYVDRDGKLTFDGKALIDALERSAGAVASIPWTSVTGKPSTFTPSAHTHPQSDVINLTTDLAAKQNTLVSGTNIKTINGISVLGSGDMSVGGAWGAVTGTLSAQTDLQAALDAKAIVKSATLSLPSLRLVHRQTITDAAISATSKVIVGLGNMGPTSENEADLLDVVSLAAAPAAGSVEVVARFLTPASGQIPIIYTIG